jgi:hypothetical protein
LIQAVAQRSTVFLTVRMLLRCLEKQLTDK